MQAEMPIISIKDLKKTYVMGPEKVHDLKSITLDIHKWFSVPMGTSIFLTSNKHILHQTFGIRTNYMPKDGDKEKITDPYIHSIQWTRPFNGLKLYLPLAAFGWNVMSFGTTFDKLFKGERLRTGLRFKARRKPSRIICN